MRTVLAFDTALGGCSVGLLAGERFAAREVETGRDQARILIPLIEEVLAELGIGFKDVDVVASTVGPGSFTGLRLGLSTVRSLGLALDRPMIGLNTLEVVARHAVSDGPGSDPVLAVLETKRSDYYVQLFTAEGQPETAPLALERTQVHDLIGDRRVILAGDAVNRIRDESGGKLPVSREMHRVLLHPRTLTALARDKAEKGEGVDLSPVYLRGADVSVSKRPPRRIQA